MSEIKREPIKIVVDGAEMAAFDEHHTLADIVRYAIAQSDREEIVYLAETVG